jgi:hypothetical protein
MTAQVLLERWRGFFFTPQSPIAVALYRIFFGIMLLLTNLLVYGPYLLDWYGPEAINRTESISRFCHFAEPRFDLLLLFPLSDSWILVFWRLYLIAVVLLTIGLWTKYSSIVVSLGLISLHNHQPFTADGGSCMLRLCSIYLVFADAGGALSIDRLIKRFRQPTLGDQSRPKPSAPLGQRMIQIQIAIAYWQSFCSKISGLEWLDGTAIYYAVRLQDVARYARCLPWLFNSLVFCKLLNWYSLVVEFAMWALVWFKDLRYYVLLAAILLHLGIDYSLRLFMFEWVMITAYINFVDPQDLTRCMDYIKAGVRHVFGGPVNLFYNPSREEGMALASVVEGLDVFGRLEIVSGARQKMHEPVLFVETERGRISGFALFSWLSARLPMLWLFYPLVGWSCRLEGFLRHECSSR